MAYQNENIRDNNRIIRNRFFILSFGYSLNIILNFLLAIQMYQQSSIYFILLVSYSTLSLIMISLLVYKKCLNLSFLFQDTFFLGFFYFKNQSLNLMQQKIALPYLFNRIAFLILIQLISFFIIQNDQSQLMPLYISALHYFCFLFSIFLFIAWLSLSDLQNEFKLFKNKVMNSFLCYLVSYGSNIIILSCYLQYKDYRGTNLGLYFMVVKEFNLFFFQIFTYFKSSQNAYVTRIFTQFCISICQNTRNPHLSIKDSFNIQNKNITLVGYINQIVLLIILMVFSSDWINEFFKNIRTQDQFSYIKLINTILAFILIILYLIFYFKRTLVFLFKAKYFIVSDENEALSVVDFLQNDQFKTKIIQIEFIKEKQCISYASQIENEEGIVFCTKQCMVNYSLIKYMTNAQKQNVHIIQNLENFQLCKCYLLKMVSDNEIIFDQISQNAAKMVQIYNQSLDQIFFERYQKGFLYSKFNQLLGEQLKHSKYLILNSYVLQQIAFQNYLKEFMVFSPLIIQYDLYDN
ncbi:hypothetical protein ABPG73_019282 [Tetrahymena malaccensis]